MVAKIGGFLGVAAGYIAWHMIGGIVGLLVGAMVVIPIASVLFIALLPFFTRAGKGSQATGD